MLSIKCPPLSGAVRPSALRIYLPQGGRSRVTGPRPVRVQ
nr:MAG TPA: hypothetical protein [Caudoviricetes sp.]